MDLKKITENLESNDFEKNSKAIETIYTIYNKLTEEEVEKLIPFIMHHLWKMPKYKVQVEFIDELLEKTDEKFRKLALNYIIDNWNKIQNNRRDKFYYFVKSLIKYYKINVKNMEHLFYITSDLKLRSYIVDCILERCDVIDTDMELFLVDYISKCPPALLPNFTRLSFDTELILKYVKNPDIGELNRKALCEMSKKNN